MVTLSTKNRMVIKANDLRDDGKEPGNLCGHDDTRPEMEKVRMLFECRETRQKQHSFYRVITQPYSLEYPKRCRALSVARLSKFEVPKAALCRNSNEMGGTAYS